jgi:hypothetical protein
MNVSWEQTRSLISAMPRPTVHSRLGLDLPNISQAFFDDTWEEVAPETLDPPLTVLLIGNLFTSYPKGRKAAAYTVYLEVDQHPTVVV